MIRNVFLVQLHIGLRKCKLACFARKEKDDLVRYFIDITKNDTIMNNWLARARLEP